MDSVRSGPYGQLFRPDNFVFGKKTITFLVLQMLSQRYRCVTPESHAIYSLHFIFIYNYLWI